MNQWLKKNLVSLWNRPQKNSLSPNEWCIALPGSPHSWVEWPYFIVPNLVPSSILMMKIPYWMSRYVAPFFLPFPMVTTRQHRWFRKLNWVEQGQPTNLLVGMLIQDQQHLVTSFNWEIFSNYYCREVVCVGNWFIREFDPNILVVP